MSLYSRFSVPYGGINGLSHDDDLNLSSSYYHTDAPPCIHDSGISFGRTSVIICRVASNLSQYFLSYPFYRYHMQCQVPIATLSARTSLFHNYIRHFMIISKFEGLSILWKGFPSFIFYKQVSLLMSSAIASQINRYVPNKFYNKAALLLAQGLLLLILSPFFTSMIVDGVLSNSVTGSRSLIFFIALGLERLYSSGRRFNTSSLSFIHTKFPSLLHITTGLFFQTLLQSLLYPITKKLMSYYRSYRSRNITTTSSVSIKCDCLPDQSNSSFSNHHDENSVLCSNHAETFIPNACTAMNDDFIANTLSELIALPVIVSTYKLALQGYGVVIDAINNDVKPSVFTVTSLPTFYRSFFDCLISVKEDHGIFGYFWGFLPFLTGIIIKFGVVFTFNKLLMLYYNYTHKSKPN